MITYIAKRVVGYPIVAIGFLFATLSEWAIRSGAWIMDITVEMEEDTDEG